MLLKSRKHINKDCCYKSECISKKKSEIHKINPILEGESLADNFPHLIQEWHVGKNGKLTPYDVSKKSHRVVWWICYSNPKHEWDDMVSNKARGRGCHYCSGKRVNEDNCLATLRSDIASEWNYIRNKKTPNDYTIGSGKKVWWICKCGYEWEATINHRTNENTGCPACNESKGEKLIREWLESKELFFIREYSFPELIGIGGGALRFDYAVFDEHNKLICLIEYDGDGHENIKIHDQLKNEYCLKNNLFLIRISYKDFDQIEDIMKNKLLNVATVLNIL